MVWFAIAAAAVSAASSISGTKESARVASKQADLVLQRLAQIRERQALESSQDARNTSNALFNIRQQNAAEKSNIQLQSAASDTIGASVQDALSTVDVVTGRAEAQAFDEYTTAESERLRVFTNETSAAEAETDSLYEGAIEEQRSALLNIFNQGAKSAASYAGNNAGTAYADSRLQGPVNAPNQTQQSPAVSTSLGNRFSSYLR